MHNLKRAALIIGIASVLGGLTPVVHAQTTPPPSPQVNTEQALQQGLDKIDAGDFQAAIDLLTKVVEANPNEVEAFYNRGLAYVQLKDYEKAIADYSQVLKLDSNDDEAYYNRGLARVELGDDAGAIADFTEVITRKPTNAEAFYNRALAYAELKEDTKAIGDLQKASELFAKQGKKTESEAALALIKKLEP